MERRSSRLNTRDVLCLLGAVFAFFCAQTVVLVLVPIAATRMDLGAAAVGAFVAVPGLTGLVGDAPLAVLSDRIGRRPMVIAGGLVGTVGGLLLAAATSPPTLALGAVLFGVAISLGFGPIVAFTTEIVPTQQQARLQGVNGAVQGAASALGALASGFLMQVASPGAGFVLASGLAGAASLLALLIHEDHRSRASAHPARTTAAITLLASYAAAARLLRARIEIRLSALIALMYIILFIVVGNSFLPLTLVSDAGLAGATVGILLALRTGVLTAVSLTFGAVATRLGFTRALVLAHGAGVVGVLAVPAAGSSLPGLVLVVAFLGIGSAFGAAGSNMLVARATVGGERALGVAATNLVSRGALLLVAPVLGSVIQAAGSGRAYIVAGMLMAGCVSLLWRGAGRLGPGAAAGSPIHA